MLSEKQYVETLSVAQGALALPGCVVQCGVWRGGLIAGLAAIFGPTRTYYLFDSFEGLPTAKEIDGPAAIAWQSDVDGPNYYNNCSAPSDFADRAMQLAGAIDYHVVPGWFEDTVPSFKFNDGIALLHLDADWYESTMTCIQSLFTKVANGGLIILDDYYAWDGCSRALHEFLAREHLVERIRCIGSVCYLQRRLAA